MTTTEDYKEYIQKLVQLNSKYSGNEDLVEDFCSEALKRSFYIISSVQDVNNIQAYLTKVVNTSILTVLKDSGRVQRSSGEYVRAPKTVSLDTQPVAPVEETLTREFSAPPLVDLIADDKINIAEQVASKEEIEQICATLQSIDSNSPDKKFLQIFNDIYINDKTQSQVAAELNISQGEVSKRMAKLSQLVYQNIAN